MNNNEILEELYNLTKFDQDQEKATVYGFNKNEDSSYIYKMLGRAGDIYQLIDNVTYDRAASNYDFVSLLTYGWAAPISESSDQDIPPSQADGRRRVRLVVVASKEEKKAIGSVLHFFDNDETIFETEHGTSGPLQDAINSIYE